MLWPAALARRAALAVPRRVAVLAAVALLSASTTVQAATLGVRWAEGALEVGVAELRTKPPGAPFAPDVGAVAEAKTVVHLASIFKKVVDVREVSCRGASLRLDVDGATGLLTLDGLARRRGARGDVPRPRLERRSSATEGLLDGLGEPFARALQNYEREVEACVGRVAALELVPFFWKSETRYRYRRFVAEDVELRESDLILAAAASATAAFRKLGDQEASLRVAKFDVNLETSTSLDDDAGIEAVKDKILDALVDVLYRAVDAGAWARLQGSAGGAALASLATRALDSGGLLEVAARKVVPLLEEARRAVESELTSVERSTSPKSRPMVQQLLRDLSDVVDDLLAVRHKTFQAGPTLKLLQRAADVARRLEGVLSKANAEHIALDARHLDDQLLAALSDFALDLGASALTALPPGRVAGDANGVEYAVDHVDLSRVRVTHENLRVAFDRDLGSESLLHVDVYGVDCPLSDLRWSVGKKDSAVFRDEGYAHAAVSNICLGLDLVAARRPGDGRPGGGAPFLALRDARVTVDACALSFDGTASPSSRSRASSIATVHRIVEELAMAKGKKRAAPAKELAMAKGKKRAAPAPEVSVEVLLAQIPRAQLEELALHLYNGNAASRDDLVAYAKRGRPAPVVAVADGEDGAHGRFDAVDGESLSRVMAYLRLADRLQAAVCINAEIMKQRPPCLPRLRTLAVGTDANGSAPHSGKWIAAAPCLEALEAPDKLATYASLSAARHAWRDARGGGDPALAHLKITGMERQDYRAVSVAGSWFPNLETLEFNANSYSEAGWDGVPPLHPFPRLRALKVQRLATYRNHFSTAMLTELVGKLLAATPNLRAFQVRHGICYSKPPLPAPGRPRLRDAPASLRELTLSDLRIDPGDLDEANELEVLRVNACFSTGKKGPEPFRAAWPDLKIVVDYEDEDAAT
ncbi:hypothetical protein JL722_8401 [Aureococcus anophagefferens]|nr:hypothetical protein JL722_8401 [Aureococcus anophagefferens]